MRSLTVPLLDSNDNLFHVALLRESNEFSDLKKRSFEIVETFQSVSPKKVLLRTLTLTRTIATSLNSGYVKKRIVLYCIVL